MKVLLIRVFAAGLLFGLASCISIDRRYEGMSFDAFIDDLNLGPDIKEDALRKQAYRAKFSANIYEFWNAGTATLANVNGNDFYPNTNTESINGRFYVWCLQNNGYLSSLPAVIDGQFTPSIVPGRPVFSISCIRNQKLLGGVAIDADHSVAFYK